jgi:hypothetical protein
MVKGSLEKEVLYVLSCFHFTFIALAFTSTSRPFFFFFLVTGRWLMSLYSLLLKPPVSSKTERWCAAPTECSPCSQETPAQERCSEIREEGIQHAVRTPPKTSPKRTSRKNPRRPRSSLKTRVTREPTIVVSTLARASSLIITRNRGLRPL